MGNSEPGVSTDNELCPARTRPELEPIPKVFLKFGLNRGAVVESLNRPWRSYSTLQGNLVYPKFRILTR